MASFEERIYELGAEALGEQERQVAEVRGRGATLLAAGAVIASLLAKPVFQGGHPDGLAEVTSTGVGLLGSAGVLVFVVMLLRPYELGFSVKPGATYRALWDQEVLVQPMVDLALAVAFEERRNANAQVVERLVSFLSRALASLVLETAGFAIAAALASQAWLRRVETIRRRRPPSRAESRRLVQCLSCRRPYSTWRRGRAWATAVARAAPDASSRRVRRRV